MLGVGMRVESEECHLILDVCPQELGGGAVGALVLGLLLLLSLNSSTQRNRQSRLSACAG